MRAESPGSQDWRLIAQFHSRLSASKAQTVTSRRVVPLPLGTILGRRLTRALRCPVVFQLVQGLLSTSYADTRAAIRAFPGLAGCTLEEAAFRLPDATVLGVFSGESGG